MGLADSIKRAPKWAWFTVAGVGAGAIAIRVWQDRDNEESTSIEGTEVGSPTYGTPGTSGSPTPVITPPVIIGGDSGDNGGLAQFVDVMGGNFDTLVSSIAGLAAGDQELAGLGVRTVGEIATSVIAQAGSAPAPMSQVPTPIVVNVPSSVPSASASAVAVATAKRLLRTCGSSFNGQDGNCRYKKVQYFSDGTSREIDNHKMHNGKCKKIATDCW